MVIPEPDGQVDTPDGKLASAGREGPTDAIRAPCGCDRRSEGARPLSVRLRPIVERYRALPDGGEIADKAFFDDLSGNL
ncbi:hypothetical protein RUR49_03665 [Pseudoxanthobacter sp. M-2]|uniref:hypothetical protein n=1 Tax=Pseudoxanthobacter sp. M-2 TaxID=3078754 RepID=UPI0038FCB6F5